MYRFTPHGQVWVSKDGVRWHDWRGRQAYKYLYGAPRART
jgi:hypothetical protein